MFRDSSNVTHIQTYTDIAKGNGCILWWSKYNNHKPVAERTLVRTKTNYITYIFVWKIKWVLNVGTFLFVHLVVIEFMIYVLLHCLYLWSVCDIVCIQCTVLIAVICVRVCILHLFLWYHKTREFQPDDMKCFMGVLIESVIILNIRLYSYVHCQPNTANCTLQWCVNMNQTKAEILHKTKGSFIYLFDLQIK